MNKLLSNSFFILIYSLPRKIIIGLIAIYQKILSPDHGWLKIYFPHGFCRFQPTCSDYAVLVFKKYGLIKGGFIVVWRLIRCNPFL